ncbi:DNA repair protein RadC [Pseudopedobacter saltans DSM 12145]|uniref:DNA repair protein RadC n=1 Tax=Pseudopedobacter saltans (strain ATCC 51119 / DSM 12145 / JCM 21818 / CCUG 39354 / LMG 10337 / NBRC 100064 / NCIMB 13643) TaxID=762903 RepID=F0S7A0_PSESL|nr:JAB domain-containing protein [Pseudopedobacter saltans]ADY51125.1 DNA repair protein RadC [Pseudopedobacter saltans DSM 12145]
MEQNVLLQVSEIQLVYRPKVKASERMKVYDAKSAYEVLLKSWDMDSIEIVEQFKIMLLNKSNKVLGISHISTGGMSGTIVDVKVLFGIALKGGACSLILAHNHPSGNITPSDADKKLTNKIIEASKYLDIEVFDHIIVTPEKFYSFAEMGLI